MNTEFLKTAKSHFSSLQSHQFLLSDVWLQFGQTTALCSINLAINKGEIIFVTGSSGAGKTSLLNVLSGDIKPSRGKCSLPNKNIFIARVFQDLRIIENATCFDNLMVAYDPALYRNKNEFVSELTEICRLLGVWDKRDLVMSKANGGLKQKIAMIRALLTRPDIIIADEPTAALDKESSTKLFELLNYYNTKKQVTIIWATHNKDLIKQFPGKMVHLDNGKLVYTGHACFI